MLQMAILCLTVLVQGQSVELTEDVIRSFTVEAEAEAPADHNALVRGVDRRVREFLGSEVSLLPYSVTSQDELLIGLTGPYCRYRADLVEQLRKMLPAGETPWSTGVAVTVAPRQIGAPDIIRVVLQRDGEQVPPLEDNLAPQEFQTRMGVSFVLHAGAVVFPLSAFAPGADVTTTAIPETGGNIVRTLTGRELERLH